MTEYIIITALIAIAAIAAVTYFGGTARAQIGAMGAQLGGQAGDMTRVQSEANNAQTAGNAPKNLANYNTGNGAAR
jgi:Flp pilus assembly pilin Flp